LRNLFDGDVTAFVTQLLDSRKLTREEVADLQRLVRNKLPGARR
jgi:predicted transcriptional regulator